MTWTERKLIRQNTKGTVKSKKNTRHCSQKNSVKATADSAEELKVNRENTAKMADDQEVPVTFTFQRQNNFTGKTTIRTQDATTAKRFCLPQAAMASQRWSQQALRRQN